MATIDEAKSGGGQQVVFIDSGLADAQGLAALLPSDVEVVWIDPAADAIAQMAEWAAGKSGYDTVHIISHGEQGKLLIGNTPVDAAALTAHAAELAHLGEALSETGDILLYGCDVGAGSEGQAFLAAFAEVAQADVAASTDRTGASEKGGDWVLEVTSGVVESQGLALTSYQDVLASGVLTFTDSPNSPTATDGVVSNDIAGIQLLITNGSGHNWTYEQPYSVAGDGIAVDYAGSDPSSLITIKSASTTDNFSFSSIFIADYGGMNITVSAYDDGVLIGSVDLILSNNGWENTFTQSNGLTASIFQNVDEIRLTPQSTPGMWLVINDIGIADAVLPNAAPTLGTVTPAGVSQANAGQTSYSFTVSYADSDGTINAASIGVGDVTVSKGGVFLTVVGASWNAATGTATYTVTPAGGTWNDADNGTWTIGLVANQVSDDDGAFVSANSNAGSFSVSMDTTRPTATVVVSDSALAVGETSLVTITFSEAVTGFTNADLSVANGTLSAVSSSDGGITWTATLTPTSSITDTTNVITLDNTGVTDGAGNAGSGTTNSNNYAIDTVRPTASIVVSDSALAVGETSLVTITFSEAVTGFTNGDLMITNGTLSAVSSSDGGITWTATLTPTASITDSTNVITIDNTGVTDSAGNAGSGTTDSNNYTIDTVRPTATIVVSDSALVAGETSLVTITFSEAVTGFTNADLSVANGTLSAVSSSDGGITWTATLTPTVGIVDTSNVIALNNTGVTDIAGNLGSGTTNSGNYTIDTVLPTATIIVADNALAIGETSLVTITFSEAVAGFTNADLSVANGTLSAVSSSDGGITWTATLTPTSSIADSTNVITLDNTGVSNASGNCGSGTTNSNNYAIDTTRPTASIVVADSALAVGETSLVTITFSEAVTGFTNADLTIANGTLSAVSSSDGGITWTATLTPTAGITDSTNVITLDNTGVTDGAGNAGSGTTDSNNYAVDSQRPTVTIVLADATLTAGETTLVTFTFSEAVTGLTNADLTVANGTLSAVSSADGGITWTATLTPTADIADMSNLITLANADVTDIAGNAGTGTTNSGNYTIDTMRPTATVIVADSALAVGETALVTITFSEAVTGFTNADLTIANGTLSAVSSSDGGITWTATLTPTGSVTDTSNVITLDNTGVSNASGNSGTGTTDSNNYAIDTQRPTATVAVADATLTAGETSLVTITFNEAVTGFTNADLTVQNGTLSAVNSADGGVTWTATLTPSAGITDTSNLITLNNTGVVDAAGNSGTGTTSSNNYAIDSVVPGVASILRLGSGTTNASSVQYTVTFTENVSGVDASDFSLTTTDTAGGTIASVTQVTGSTYTVTVNGITGDGTLRLDLDSSGTGIADTAGNAIATGFTTGQTYDVDRVAPVVTSVGVPANATYAGGDKLEFTVHLSSAVVVNTTGGTPKIAVTLDTGGTVYASYESGSGSSSLVFRMPVTASQTDMTGIVLGTGIVLNGSTIRDTAGNALVLGLNGVPSTTAILIGNDAPTLTGDLKATVAEGGSYKLTAADIGFSDPDDSASGVRFTVSSLANGTVLVNGKAATGFTAADIAAGRVTFRHDGSETVKASFKIAVEDGNEDGSVAVKSNFNVTANPVNDGFTAADIAAGRVTFRHDGSETVKASFKIAVEDGNEDGSVAVKSTFNVTANPVNDAPTLTGDLKATVAEGGTYKLTAADIGFSDPDDSASGVRFTVSSLANGTVLSTARRPPALRRPTSQRAG
ncbi:hypothetical protein ASC86_18720 [Rhizobium sp. Root1212]|nr:hypothetical protein ASC86_18720 [Rhizobium sp. Root1212]